MSGLSGDVKVGLCASVTDVSLPLMVCCEALYVVIVLQCSKMVIVLIWWCRTLLVSFVVVCSKQSILGMECL